VLSSADADQVATLAVSIFERLQNYPRKEYQLLAIACAFLLLSRAGRVPAQETFTYATNLMTDPLREEGMGRSFAGLLHYLENWLEAGKGYRQ
jgi:hypothetical protein